jgi:glyoxylase-like metal-dependent hydrolase (beta-lactamase superfamily II)
MEYIRLSRGLFDSNCYILIDNNECAIIDAGVEAQQIMEVLQDKGLTARYIILTHGHLDHIHHVDAIQKATGAEICLHEEELELYANNAYNGYDMFPMITPHEHPKPHRLLKHGDRLPFGQGELEIIHTPGHSQGSISVLWGNQLFTGDTLFAQSVGRTDLYGGSGRKILESIRNRLYTLPEDCTVHPGHGGSTTIGYEREHNPYA